MRKYILRKIPQLIPLILFAIILNFTLMHLAPGSPLDYLIGMGEIVPQAYIDRLTREYHLDKPLYEQLLIYLATILRGDFGISYRYRQPVLGIILERVPNTLLLMGASIVLACIFGVILGIASAKRPYSFLDNIASSVSILGYSIPTFWLGMMLIILLSVHLGGFPIFRNRPSVLPNSRLILE